LQDGESMSEAEVDIKVRPVEIMRVKNIIRGRASELGDLMIKFSDEIGGKSLPCSGFEPMTITAIITGAHGEEETIDRLVAWIKNKWK